MAAAAATSVSGGVIAIAIVGGAIIGGNGAKELAGIFIEATDARDVVDDGVIGEKRDPPLLMTWLRFVECAGGGRDSIEA